MGESQDLHMLARLRPYGRVIQGGVMRLYAKRNATA